MKNSPSKRIWRQRIRCSQHGVFGLSGQSRRGREGGSTIARDIVYELRDQRSNLKLIASENYSPLPVSCMGNSLR